MLAVALAAAAVALPAHAVPRPADPSPPRAARAFDADAERARLLSRLPSERVPVDAPAGEPTRYYASLLTGGDLDGDGGSDVVDLRYRDWVDPTTGQHYESTRIEVFRGRDGALLWTKELDPSWLTVPVATKVGPSGANGVVVVTYTLGAVTYDTTVTAYDGRGKQVWKRSMPGVFGVVPAARRAVVDGLVDAVPGGGTDLVVTTALTGPVAGVSRTQVSVIDGADGTLRDIGEPVAGEHYGLRAVPVGDIDRDRVEDVVLADGEGLGRGALKGFSLRTGVTRWSTAALPTNDRWDVRGIADATGDGVRDVTVAAVAARVEAPKPAEVALVDGATGRTAWRRPGDGALAVGDIDRRRGTEVVVGLRGDARLALAAYDGRGVALWRTSRSLPAAEAIHTESGWYDAGDAGPDGVRDVRYRVVSRDNDRERRDEGSVDGRTGRVRRDAVPRMATSVLPIDGRGSDTFAPSGPLLTFTAYRGNGPDRLWSVTPNASGAALGAWTAELDGDRCADLLVAMNEGGALTVHAFSGATGRPLWRLMRWEYDAARVTHPRPHAHRQYARSC